MDWNHDGKLDILSGCYWTEGAQGGQIQILAGRGEGDFAEAESVLNADGQPLQNVALEDADNENQILTICTQQHAADYDGDGDLDLVVGCFGNAFFYYENTAKPGERPSLSTSPVRLPVESPSYHAAPHLADWDRDGDLDLLSGAADGSVLVSENRGSAQKPEWAPFQPLIPASSSQEQMVQDANLRPGAASRVWATDWNRDGWLDLLVGDSMTLVTIQPGLTPEEHQERRAAHQKEMADFQAKYQEVMTEYQKTHEEKKEPSEELMEKVQAYSREFSELYSKQAEYQTTEMTGSVWLYLRKPPADP